MKKVIFCIGISGCGKSTWASNFLKNTSEFIRCNRDDIRRTLIGNLVNYYKRRDLNGFEKIVSTIMYYIIKIAINKKKSLIIDNTNLKIKDLNNLLKQFDNSNYEINFKLFDCKLNVAKNRVVRRDYYDIYEDQITLDCESIDLSQAPEVDYIDKQYQQYINIKEYILKTYPNNIIYDI